MVHCIVRRHTYTRIKTQSKITYVTGPILLDITQCINTSSLRSNPIILELFSSNFFKLYSLLILSFLSLFIACLHWTKTCTSSIQKHVHLCTSAVPTSQHSLQPRQKSRSLHPTMYHFFFLKFSSFGKVLGFCIFFIIQNDFRFEIQDSLCQRVWVYMDTGVGLQTTVYV